MLELKNITKFYGNKKILSDISFNIDKRKLAVLLGPSGCGKTTLLKIIAGLEDLNSGKVIMDKNVLSKKGHYMQPNKRNLNMVFQNLALWPHMTVKDHILFSLCSKGNLNRNNRKNKLIQILAKFKLVSHMQKYPNQLSGGEKQRLAIARAIATEPEILLLDEPLVNLDLSLKIKIQKLLIKLNKEEKITILYVTHDQIEALMMAEKIIIMNEGRVEQVDSPYNLILNPKSEFVANFMKFEYEFVEVMKKKLLQ